MLKRYALKEMTEVWSEANKFRLWYIIEAYACEALLEIGLIPESVVKELWNSQPEPIDVNRIKAIEKSVQHESIAFQMYVTEICPSIANEKYHHGLTSSDILDTCFGLQLVSASELLTRQLKKLSTELQAKALNYKYTPCIGRSHGIHAEPTTFGLKLARAFAEVQRNCNRLNRAQSEISVGMLSGPVGNYTNINPYVEEYVCRKLGLSVETISSQIIPRDRYAMYFSTIGVIASSIERISIELRQLQMTEISEVAESFSSSQKGSSAMPHKKNPILLENVTGLSRMVKAYVSPALDNVSLWQERDMSHSSVERIIGPDATITLDFAIHRLTQIISNLVINEQSMLENLNLLNGVTYSQPVLLRLIEKGLNKEKAYRMVQKSAQKTMANGLDFLTELRSDDDYAEWLSEEELVRIFDPLVLNVRVDTIFERLLNEFDPA